MRNMSEEDIRILVDTLNQEHMITSMEEPFSTHYMAIKEWESLDTQDLIKKGYEGTTLLSIGAEIDEDPTNYVLYNPDKCTTREALNYLHIVYRINNK